jgi:hypothetical protein
MQIYVIIIVLLITGTVAAAYFSHRRDQEMRWLAAELELDYNPADDPEMGSRFRTLWPDRQTGGPGHRHWYARNTFSGRYRGHRVIAGDLHLSYRRDFGVFLLTLPRPLPHLLISPEGATAAINPNLEYEDVSFESAEFSRLFRVRADDKKFAYDVCHPRMIEFLLANRRLTVQIKDDTLALIFNWCLRPKWIRFGLDRLVEFRELLPDYLFSGR